MTPRLFAFFVPILLVAPAWTISAQSPTPIGGEFRTHGDDRFGHLGPDVAMSEAGDFVVAWTSSDYMGIYVFPGPDGSAAAVQAARYDADGNRIGQEFVVNSYTTNRQNAPSVAMDAEGGFIVTWSSGSFTGVDPFADVADFNHVLAVGDIENGPANRDGPDGSGISVQGQRFDSMGMRVGDEFQVNTYTTDDQQRPDVAIDAAGNFVVVWQGQGATGNSIFAQRFDSTGNKIGTEIQVPSTTTPTQFDSQVAMDADGRFVVSWTDGSGSDGSEQGVQLQAFDAMGNPVGGNVLVNSYTTGDQWGSRLAALDNDSVVVTWNGRDELGENVRAQRFDYAGQRLGDEIRVTSTTPPEEPQWASVASKAGQRSFIVTWASNANEISFQRFGSTGSPIGEESSYMSPNALGGIETPEVAMDSLGRFVVAWQASSDGQIQYRDNYVDGQRFGGGFELFEDGFESGTLAAWADPVP